MILLITGISVKANTITVTQNNDILTISSDENVNVTVAFYDVHQVYLENVTNFNAYNSTNVTIPSSISYTGGYYRICYVNESISSQEFQSIAPWDDQQGGNVQNTEENATVSDIDDLPVAMQDGSSTGIAGEFFVISVSSVALVKLGKKVKK